MNKTEKMLQGFKDFWFEVRWVFRSARMKGLLYIIGLIIYCLIWFVGLFTCVDWLISKAHAAEFTTEQIVNAIYLAEGGTKTKFPYGILTKYKTTTPRQACINTVNNQRKRHAAHNCGKDFLTCLRDRYCPLNANNDPRGLNRNWLRLVKFFLRKNAEAK